MNKKNNFKMLKDSEYNAIIANTTSALELAILLLLGLGMMRVSELITLLLEDYDPSWGMVDKRSSKTHARSWPLSDSIRYYLNMYLETERDRLVKEATAEGRTVPAEMFIYRAKDGQIRPVNRRYIEKLFHRALERAGIDKDEFTLLDLRHYGIYVNYIRKAVSSTLTQSDLKKNTYYYMGKSEENE